MFKEVDDASTAYAKLFQCLKLRFNASLAVGKAAKIARKKSIKRKQGTITNKNAKKRARVNDDEEDDEAEEDEEDEEDKEDEQDEENEKDNKNEDTQPG